MTVYETTSHQTIYHWCTSRGLWPACLRGQPDRIRLGGDEFAPEEEALEPIEWWRWFQEFDRRNLQLIYDPSKGWVKIGAAPEGDRVVSVDVLRGVVMFLMLFVNDVGDVRPAPAWMKHIHPSNA